MQDQVTNHEHGHDEGFLSEDEIDHHLLAVRPLPPGRPQPIDTASSKQPLHRQTVHQPFQRHARSRSGSPFIAYPEGQVWTPNQLPVPTSHPGTPRAQSFVDGPSETGHSAVVNVEDTNESKGQLEDDGEKLCRICFMGVEEEEELGRLISPCLCSGSMRVSLQREFVSDKAADTSIFIL